MDELAVATPLTDSFLNGLRAVGDPRLYGTLSHLEPNATGSLPSNDSYLTLVGRRGVLGPAELASDEKTARGDTIPKLHRDTILGWWKDTQELGATISEEVANRDDELSTARYLFRKYGNEIAGALFLAALPEAYATKWGARVIASSGQLQSNLQRRIRGTAQFLLYVIASDGDIRGAWQPETGSAFKAVMGLRLFHHVIRSVLSQPELSKELGPDNKVPLNQEDLLGTLLTFSVTVFEVLERFGISWSEDEQWAYLAAWSFIGKYLGICDHAVRSAASKAEPFGDGPWSALDPKSVSAARLLLSRLRDRQWEPVMAFQPTAVQDPKADQSGDESRSLEGEWDSLQPGRRLMRALVNELAGAMPRRTESWPLAVMCELAPNVVRDRLALGTRGLSMAALAMLPAKQVPVGRFTRVSVVNPMSARVLRTMANEVTRRAIVHFLQSSEPPFVIPGLKAWSTGLRMG